MHHKERVGYRKFGLCMLMRGRLEWKRVGCSRIMECSVVFCILVHSKTRLIISVGYHPMLLPISHLPSLYILATCYAH